VTSENSHSQGGERAYLLHNLATAKKSFSHRGDELYEREIRPHLTAEDKGKIEEITSILRHRTRPAYTTLLG
jgi:hypothetical protein